jgi:hypothetical protein
MGRFCFDNATHQLELNLSVREAAASDAPRALICCITIRKANRFNEHDH